MEGEGLGVVEPGQDTILLLKHGAQSALERLFMEQVSHTDTDPAHLVGVGRSDPPSGRTNFPFAQGALLELVEHDVVGHDHVGAITDEESTRSDPTRFQRVQFIDECLRIDYHPWADHIDRIRIEDTGGDEVELKGTEVVDHRVASVIATAIAYDKARPIGEQVYQMAFSFITPLSADQCNNCQWCLLSLHQMVKLVRPTHDGGWRLPHQPAVAQ